LRPAISEWVIGKRSFSPSAGFHLSTSIEWVPGVSCVRLVLDRGGLFLLSPSRLPRQVLSPFPRALVAPLMPPFVGILVLPFSVRLVSSKTLLPLPVRPRKNEMIIRDLDLFTNSLSFFLSWRHVFIFLSPHRSFCLPAVILPGLFHTRSLSTLDDSLKMNSEFSVTISVAFPPFFSINSFDFVELFFPEPIYPLTPPSRHDDRPASQIPYPPSPCQPVARGAVFSFVLAFSFFLLSLPL